MKIRNLIFAILAFPAFACADNGSVELVVSTHFNANLTTLFWASTIGDVRGQFDGSSSGSIRNRETLQAYITPNTDCLKNPYSPCSNGNFTLQFLYSKHRYVLCEYQYNLYTQKGGFISNTQAVVADEEKPITCYAKTLPGYIFIFVKNVA